MKGIITIDQQEYIFKTKFKEVHNNHALDEKIIYVYYRKPGTILFRKIILAKMDVSYGEYKDTLAYKEKLKEFNKYITMPIQQLMELISLVIEIDLLNRKKKHYNKVNEHNDIKNMYRRS